MNKQMGLKSVVLAVVASFCFGTAPAQPAESRTRVSVGMIGKLDQVLIPGGELEAQPTSDPLAKIVVRVAETFRHGDAFRYNLEFTGMEPGRYDLTKSLKRKKPDEPTANMAPIEVEVISALPDGKIEPSKPNAPMIPGWMLYWTKLDVLVVVWIIGLALIWGKSKTTSKVAAQAELPPQTLGQRLKPLVQAACDGTIKPNQRAELESLLIRYWTSKLELANDIAPGLILTTLKNHAEAGPLILQMEGWLHMPVGEGMKNSADLATLLKPYDSISESPTMPSIPGKGQA